VSETFGAGARLLAGHMARLHGWQPGEFWQATPAELAAVLGPPDPSARPLDRASLNHLMEFDNDRSG
jgi:uncharacterized phage protein (TIGR02216 family)